jgi:hypothetical protein
MRRDRKRERELAVIDLDDYANEFREVQRLLQSPPEVTIDEKLSEALGGVVHRHTQPLSRRATSGLRGARIAAVAGQYLIWDRAGLPCPRYVGPDDHPDTPAFYQIFGLYWRLLSRKLLLDLRTASDLVRVERAGPGNTETTHALMKRLEANFTTPIEHPLDVLLLEWADEFAVSKYVREQKLATRLYKLIGS